MSDDAPLPLMLWGTDPNWKPREPNLDVRPRRVLGEQRAPAPWRQEATYLPTARGR